MGKEKLVKSKERVKKYAEVYTPEWCVKKMCDMCDEESGGHALTGSKRPFWSLPAETEILLQRSCGGSCYCAGRTRMP